MKKLTFERAVLIVFILIILISTSDLSGKYIEMAGKFIDKLITKEQPPLATSGTGGNFGFPSLLAPADKLFAAGNYEKAANEYFALTLNNALNSEQKAHAYFRMGVCQYNLKKYQLAFDSFSRVIAFNANDSTAYNNAAVSAYKAKDLNRAIELQQKSLKIYPAVEYYYNLARMYEDSKEYDLAADNYLITATAEQNITRIERIDPVRVKEKSARLLLLKQSPMIDNVNNALMALKLKDTKEILIIDENEMQFKKNFTVKVDNQQDKKHIIAKYDRKEYDPYNLITELLWTVFKDGKLIYKKTGDNIDLAAADGGNYEIKLNAKYNGNEGTLTTKTVKIKENQSTINDGKSDNVVFKPTPRQDNSKYYMYSIYEQLFESDFKISSSGYSDKYGVFWGKDSGIETSRNKSVARDKASSLIVNNTTYKDAGLWINLDSLLKNNDIKGKTILISFYAREITDNAEIYVNARVKTKTMSVTSKETFYVPFKFQQNSIKVYIPQDAVGITVSIKTMANEQFNIDGFTVTD